MEGPNNEKFVLNLKYFESPQLLTQTGINIYLKFLIYE